MTKSARSTGRADADDFEPTLVRAWEPDIAVSANVTDTAAISRFAEHIRGAYTAPGINFGSAEPLTVMGKHFAVISQRSGLVPQSIHTIPAIRWHQAFALVRQVQLYIEEDDVGLVAASSGAHNYYHWLAETVGAAIMHRLLHPGAAVPLILPTITRTWQRDTLDMFNIDNRIIEVGLNDAAVFDGAILTNITARDYGFLPHPAILRQFGAQLARHKIASSGADLIYLARLDAGDRRRMANELELCAMLERRGFRIIIPSEHSAAEQAGFLREAKLVVAPHGAALGNLLYCAESDAGPCVIELQQEAYLSRIYAKLCQAKALNYSTIISARDGSADYHHSSTWLADIDLVEIMLERKFAAIGR
ncbi:glycosyltransferase 61 family protein [Rhizorhabdus sp.]|uniref:glycosyltransferase family 61 protein n=1 Tax=Rhizorhabdus sp. TaxID=1968843 RepID=UPI0019B5F494|nr:glycosyltransferase 61 family protein [Rhizorhabdus sp.]MBD3760134.1 glycosyltransferase family 61 protein [Rhizorhabdus sp.]